MEDCDLEALEAEIAEAEERRVVAVQAVKEEFPYPASADSTEKPAQDKPLSTLY